jgi:oligopeptide transport system ATP-binding protein
LPRLKIAIDMPLLSVNSLSTTFHVRGDVYRAVQDLSFDIEPGEILGIVGESGSGKSVTCYSLLGLIAQPPGRIEGGTALFDGIDLLSASEKQLRSLRGRRIAIVFQDPMSSLNPYMRIQEQVIEPLLIHGLSTRTDALKRALEMLEAVGINDPERRLRQFPHEFSGGMRQRMMIAMALIARPELLIADEPTTALDVTVQAQILDLIREKQRETGMAVIYITHDLSVVAGLCHRVLVMYAGRIVESADLHSLFKQPRHPYTRALQRSIPSLHAKGEELQTIPGMPPDVSKPIQGCSFAPRCDFATAVCRTGAAPALVEVAPGHSHACLRIAKGELS